MRAILRRAERKWRWIERAPYIELDAEPKGRVRWLKLTEIVAMLGELPSR